MIRLSSGLLVVSVQSLSSEPSYLRSWSAFSRDVEPSKRQVRTVKRGTNMEYAHLYSPEVRHDHSRCLSSDTTVEIATRSMRSAALTTITDGPHLAGTAIGVPVTVRRLHRPLCNELIGETAGHKRKEIDAYFENAKYLGFSILVQSPRHIHSHIELCCLRSMPQILERHLTTM